MVSQANRLYIIFSLHFQTQSVGTDYTNVVNTHESQLNNISISDIPTANNTYIGRPSLINIAHLVKKGIVKFYVVFLAVPRSKEDIFFYSIKIFNSIYITYYHVKKKTLYQEIKHK